MLDIVNFETEIHKIMNNQNIMLTYLIKKKKKSEFLLVHIFFFFFNSGCFWDISLNFSRVSFAYISDNISPRFNVFYQNVKWNFTSHYNIEQQPHWPAEVFRQPRPRGSLYEKWPREYYVWWVNLYLWCVGAVFFCTLGKNSNDLNGEPH